MHELRDGKDKEGNAKKQKRTTYHANLGQICDAIIDRSAGGCESLEELRELLKNQCQGCQAGWPLVEVDIGPKGYRPLLLHVVNSGYEGERVICTKDKYEEYKEGKK